MDDVELSLGCRCVFLPLPFFPIVIRLSKYASCLILSCHRLLLAYFVQFQSIRNSVVHEYGEMSVGESVASSAVKTCIDIGAKLIVIMSEGGKMAQYVAKFRPGVAAMMVTPNLIAARQASGLLLGMHTIQVDSLEKSEEIIEEVFYELVQANMMNLGDKVIFIAGRASSFKERLMILEVTAGQSYGRFVKGGGLFFNRGLLLRFGTYDGN